MRVKELMELLGRFDPESRVRLCMSLPGRVIQTHEQIWVADYGQGPQIQAALDFAPFTIYVGCGLEQMVHPVFPNQLMIDLGQYDDPRDADHVQDFYVFHKRLNLPLHYPGFDYENWIPPRTRSGQYNRYIAEILRAKLSTD